VFLLGSFSYGFVHWVKKVRPFLHLESAQLSASTIQIQAPELGRMVGKAWQEGDRFQQGEILFSLDPETSQTAQKDFDSRMDSCSRTLEQEKENLEVVMQKYLHLQIEKAPKEFVDKVLLEIQEAQQNIMRLEEEDSLLEAEKIALQSVRQQHSILAPFDGIILRSFKQPHETAAAGESILTILNAKSLWIETEVPEEKLSALQLGIPAFVEFKSFQDKKWAARVSWISPVVEKGKIKIRLVGDDFPIHPGLSARVSIKISP
jgi:HlyD family secretion protein